MILCNKKEIPVARWGEWNLWYKFFYVDASLFCKNFDMNKATPD